MSGDGSAAAAGSALPLTWVDEIGSTQVELVARARGGATAQALATTAQTAGHGRRGREWTCPRGAGLALSVLARPDRRDAWTWLPLMAGVAVVEALESLGAVGLALKWPNDVLAPSGKLAGIVAERVESPPSHPGLPPAFVLGVGINLTDEGLPATAACLQGLGLDAGARPVAGAVLEHLGAWLRRWDDNPADVASAYRTRCGTLGRDVRVVLPSGGEASGQATAIDHDGCLVLETPSGRQVFSAGDVVHLRPR